MKHALRLIFLALALPLAAVAQQPAAADFLHEGERVRPVTSSYMVLTGAQQYADTYLTPLRYKGWGSGVLYQRAQAMRFSPERWTMQLSLGANFASTENPAKNAKMLGVGIDASWGMMRRWALPMGFSAGIGPELGVKFGALYLSRNGNNPASVRAAATVNALGYLAWKHHLWGKPITLRYQASMPVCGVFFSPNYGQLYYQIYLGDHQKLAHAAWWGSYFALDNLLTFDIAFGATTLRVGYRGNLISTEVNHLVTNDYSHSLVLGLCTEWLSISPARKSMNASIISAY